MSSIRGAYRDDGPLAILARRRGAAAPRRWGWLGPPAVRAVEYATVTLIATAAGGAARPAAFALLAVVAFHHYDLVYRLRYQGRAPGQTAALLGLGWDGRTALLLAAWAAGVVAPAAIALAVWCGAVYSADIVKGWRRHGDGSDAAPALPPQAEDAGDAG